MDLQLSAEHEALRKTVEEFARGGCPVIGDYYARGEFPLPIVESMGKLGLFGCRSRGVRRHGR